MKNEKIYKFFQKSIDKCLKVGYNKSTEFSKLYNSPTAGVTKYAVQK